MTATEPSTRLPAGRVRPAAGAGRPYGAPLEETLPAVVDVVSPAPNAEVPRAGGRPLLVRLLRLQHLRPAGWQRFLLGDVPVVLAVLLVLADVASAWLLLALPLSVAAMVKLHDVVAGTLAREGSAVAGRRES